MEGCGRWELRNEEDRRRREAHRRGMRGRILWRRR